MSKSLPEEELIDTLVANNFGYRTKENRFMSHRVSIGDSEDMWFLYAKTPGTQTALEALFKNDCDITVQFMGAVRPL